MAEAYDLLLDGKGYLLAPGRDGYRRGMDVASALGTPPVRQVQRDWGGGVGRRVQQEQDRVFKSSGLQLALGGEGVGPGPLETVLSVSGLATAARHYGVVFPSGATLQPWVACGTQLYRVDRNVGNTLSALTPVGAALSQTITGLCTDGAFNLYLALSGAGYAVYTVSTATWDLTPTVPLQGIAFYAGSLWGLVLSGNRWRLARATSATTWEDVATLDGAPRAVQVVGDALYVGTDTGLWRVSGTVVAGAFSGTVEPLVATAALTYRDFCYLVAWRGELCTVYGGQVVRLHISAVSGGNSRVGATLTALCDPPVRNVVGLCAVRGGLVACVDEWPPGLQESRAVWLLREAGAHGVGAGWWCIARAPSNGTRAYVDCLSGGALGAGVGGYATDADLLVFHNGQSTVGGVQLTPQAGAVGAAASGEFLTSLWCGRHPDQEKSWTRVGLELAWPEVASFASATVELFYSLDGGATQLSLASMVVSSTGPATLSVNLPGGSIGKWLQVRYRLSGVSATSGGPVLAALWAEYRLVEVMARRRHWRCMVLVGDGLIRRDGRAESRRGAGIAADLWAAYLGGQTLALRDVDYDLDPVERRVRVVDVEERRERPGDSGRWGEGVIMLSMVEV